MKRPFCDTDAADEGIWNSAAEDDAATERVNDYQLALHSSDLNDATERVINDQLMQSNQLRIQVEFKGGMWWEMPLELSSELLQKNVKTWRKYHLRGTGKALEQDRFVKMDKRLNLIAI